MQLTNHIFLFIFFPLSFILYLVIKDKYKKIYLIFISSLFILSYSVKDFIILLFLVLINFLISKKVYKNKKFLIMGIVLNTLVLLIKYVPFIVTNLNYVFKTKIEAIELIMPIGLSFIIFQNISYIVDLYKEKLKIKLFDFLLYSFYFPRLLNGPIMRIASFKEEIEKLKNSSIDIIFEGIKRISFGLGKVCILSFIMGNVWDTIYLNMKYISNPLIAWLGILCYSLYLYLNFSGFIDISIGISKMYGIDLPENFDYPYSSKSISEFWRRWHISLSNWFKDYIYIPLGGNKKHIYLNIMIVFLLTGIWHGASWNFIFWGIYLGILNVIDKIFKKHKFYNKIPKIAKIFLTDFFIIMGWVMFASSGLEQATKYYKFMMGLNSVERVQYELSFFINSYNIVFIIISILISLGIYNKIIKRIRKNHLEFFEGVVSIIILLISIVFIISNTYIPSLYANF